MYDFAFKICADIDQINVQTLQILFSVLKLPSIKVDIITVVGSKAMTFVDECLYAQSIPAVAIA